MATEKPTRDTEDAREAGNAGNTKNERRLARVYSAAAGSYDRANAHVLRVGGELVGVLEGVASPERVVDFGCGTGTLSLALARAFPKASVVACDLAAGMVAHARVNSTARNLNYSNGGLDWLGGQSGFDLLFSNAVLHWLPDLGSAVKAFAGALNPNGVLAFTSYLKGSYEEVDLMVRGLFEGHRAVVSFPTGEYILKALSKAGLESVVSFEEEFLERFDSMQQFLRVKRERGAPMVGLGSGELSYAQRRGLRAHLDLASEGGFCVAHRVGTYLARRASIVRLVRRG